MSAQLVQGFSVPVQKPPPPWLRVRVLLLLLAGAGCTPAHCQTIHVAPPTLRPNSLLGNTILSLSATPASLSFTLNPTGLSTSSGSIAVTCSLLNPLLTTVTLYAYFLNSSAALTGIASGASIPSSAVQGLMPTGGVSSYTAFSQSSPFGSGSALKVLTLNGLTLAHTETDALTLQINLSGLPQLPADTYSGTLYLQAQMF